MGKMQTYFIFYSLAIRALPGASAHDSNTMSTPRALGTGTHLPVEQWLSKVTRGTGETITHLHFFIQDRISGPNRTVFNVAEASITSNSPVMFGRTQVVDHLVTAGPKYDSARVGRIQGIHVLDDLHEPALTVNWNVVFTQGKYKGSTITLLGRLVAYATEGELSIVAGTGKFLLARGMVLKRTYSTDPRRKIWSWSTTCIFAHQRPSYFHLMRGRVILSLLFFLKFS